MCRHVANLQHILLAGIVPSERHSACIQARTACESALAAAHATAVTTEQERIQEEYNLIQAVQLVIYFY